MKKLLIPALAAVLCAAVSSFGQTATSVAPSLGAPRQVAVSAQGEEELYTFDLDFAGGTPDGLVAAIHGKPARHRDGGFGPNMQLNLIIPPDCRDIILPPIRVRNVTVADLFAALGKVGGHGNARYHAFSPDGRPLNDPVYEFSTNGKPRNDSVWTFGSSLADGSGTGRARNECRFYELAPYLETYKVEDITTAVETAWKMLGEPHTPQMEFHKETKLLIAVGQSEQLQVIDNALQQLSGSAGLAAKPPGAQTMSPAMIKRYHLDPQGKAASAPDSEAQRRFFERYGVQRTAPTQQAPDTNEAPAIKP